MLKPTDSFDTLTQIDMRLHGRIAADPDTRAHIARSNGYARYGTADNYVLVVPGVAGNGRSYHSPYKARSDADAIEIGQRRLEKALRRYERTGSAGDKRTARK